MTNTTSTVSPARTPQVGDILVSSWGYEQTNIDFYRVLKVSKARVTLVRVNKTTVSNDGMMGGKTVPHGDPIGAPVSRGFKSFVNWDKQQSYGVRLSSYEWATPWNGEPQTFTSYH